MCFKVTTSDALDVSTKFFLMFYWLFDSSSILSKLKLLSFDVKNQTKIASTFWFLATVVALIKLIVDLQKLLNQKAKDDTVINNPDLDRKIFNLYLNIIGKLGDLLPSAQGAELPQMILGRSLDEKLVGCGGFIAALIAIRNAWK